MTTQDSQRKRSAGRSPSYPDFDLGESLDKAGILWREEKRNLAPISAIMGHWGFKPNTGPSLRAVAALKKFGLLTDQGRGPTRQAKLSEVAIRIILDEREDSKEKVELIKQLALTPSIHKELWDEYEGSLPSDRTLKYSLITKRGFSELGAAELIKEFRKTIEFAKLSPSDNITDENSDSVQEPEEEDEMISQAPQQLQVRQPIDHTMKQVHLPLFENKWAILQAPFPLTDADWKQMEGILTAMKPALVQKAPPSSDPANVASDDTDPLSSEAKDLIKKYDDGDIPPYMTDGLKRIALEHGIEVADQDNPHDIIKTLRSLGE